MEEILEPIQYVRGLLKEWYMKPLKRVRKGEYTLLFEDYNITVRESPDTAHTLFFEYGDMAVRGISSLRLSRICSMYCSDTVSVSNINSYNIIFRKKAVIFNQSDVCHSLLELLSIINCVAEEFKFQMLGNCEIINLDKRKALEKEKEQDAENDKREKHCYSSFHFQKSTNGDGFKAVAGMSDLKALLNRDFIHTIVCKELAGDYGITPPNGILLYGPPGCGKTYIAERLAEETHIKYALIKPSDIGSTFVHGSEERINMLFKEAEENAPCLLIFDEFDALVPSRDISGSECQSEEINEFLVHLNNCAERGVYVIAMSNHPERIDRAILRKGRMDKCIYVPAPDEQTRAQIFNLSLNHRLCSNNIDLFELARLTEGYSSSDISYIVHETARTCFEETLSKRMNNRKRISQADLKRTIENTLPSISATDLKKYDKVREELNDRQLIKCGRRKLGF